MQRMVRKWTIADIVTRVAEAEAGRTGVFTPNVPRKQECYDLTAECPGHTQTRGQECPRHTSYGVIPNCQNKNE
jgi:hypothetical protein